MKVLTWFALPLAVFAFTACTDQPTAPDPELTALFAKGGKPGKPDKPGGGEDPTPPAPAIAFVAVASSNDGGGTDMDLMVMDADGGNPTVLLHSDTDDFWFPAWCSDVNKAPGEQPGLVYERRRMIGQVADLWGVEVLVDENGLSAGRDEVLIEGAAFAECSPSANTIAYTKMDNWEDENPQGIWLYYMDLGTESPLVPDPLPLDDEFDAIWSAWNQAGTAIAYQYCHEDPEVGYTCSLRYRPVDDFLGENETIVREDFWFSALDWSRTEESFAVKAGFIRIVEAREDAPEPRVLENSGFGDSPAFPPATGANAAQAVELIFMNRRGKSGSGKRKIVLYDLLTDSERTLYERKGYHLYEPDWKR